MAASIRSLAQDVLLKTGTISVGEDILGVYGSDNPRTRSLTERINLIKRKPFVRVAIVTVRPEQSTASAPTSLQLDLDAVNDLYLSDCDAWVYPMASIVVRSNLLGVNGLLDQIDCSIDHSVSPEEKALFSLGRDLGANIVAYYIGGSVESGILGCAAHPPDRRGFWLIEGEGDGFVFAHELCHVVGSLGHVSDSADNLMFPSAAWSNPPPDLNPGQCNSIHGDPDMEG